MAKDMIFCCIAGDFLAEEAIGCLNKIPGFTKKVIIFSCIDEALNVNSYIPVLFFTPSFKRKIKLKQNLITAAYLFLDEPIFKISPYLVACLNDGEYFDSSVKNIAIKYLKWQQNGLICPWSDKPPTNYIKCNMFLKWKEITRLLFE